MPKCPGCNKFAGIEEQDPELEREDVTFDYVEGKLDSITVEIDIRIVNQSECCNDDMTEATLTLSNTFSGDDLKALEAHNLEGVCELSYEVGDGERDSYQGKGGRRAPMFYGAQYEVVVNCSCGKLPKNTVTFTVKDHIQASSMDEC